ncbi:MAG: divalent-cation tolerance protein CutA [Thermoplasmata archaeon]
MDPADATGPMRLVLCAFPDDASARTAIGRALTSRLAACAQRHPIASMYWWRGRIETAAEVVVVFKTVPKRVGALFRQLAEGHPHDVPEIVEIDVPRVHAPYLAYLAATIDADAPPPPLGGGSPSGGRRTPRRPGSRRGRGARRPARTRGRRRRP